MDEQSGDEKISIELTTFSFHVRAQPGKCHDCHSAPVLFTRKHARINKLWQVNGTTNKCCNAHRLINDNVVYFFESQFLCHSFNILI